MSMVDVRARFDSLDSEVAAAKTAANEAKTAVNNLGAAVNAMPASIAGSTQVKEAIKEAVERSNIGSNVSDAKAAAEAAKAAAEATKTAVDNIPRDITLPPDAVQALKEEIRNTVRAEIAAQGIDDSAIRAAVSDLRLATDTLKTNAGAFDVNKILDALEALDERISRIEKTSKLAAYVPDTAKQALNDAYAPFSRASALPD